MVRFVVCLVLASTAFAQKKPITLETLKDPARTASGNDAPGPPTWAPDGKSFAYRQGRDLRLYTAATQTSKLIVSLETLDAAALKPAEDGPAEWIDRRA